MEKGWLEDVRKRKNLTQEQLAKKVGIDRSYYSKIESGHIPSVKVAKRIAGVLGFKWTIFFDFDKECAKTE